MRLSWPQFAAGVLALLGPNSIVLWWLNRRAAAESVRLTGAQADQVHAQTEQVTVETIRGVMKDVLAERDSARTRANLHREWDDEVIEFFSEVGQPWRSPPPL